MVKQDATLNDQAGIQQAFQEPAQLSGFGCVCFFRAPLLGGGSETSFIPQ